MDVVIIEFDGEIEDFPVLVQTLDSLVMGGARYVILDLHTLPFINSAALGYLVTAQKSLEREGGELVLCRVAQGVKNILELTELDSVLPAFDDDEEAIAYLNAESDGVQRHSWRT